MTYIRRSVRGWLALAAFLGGLSLPFVSARHFWGLDDPACDQATVLGLKTTRSFITATPTPTATHCAICHWQRAVGGATTTASQTVVVWLTGLDSAVPVSADFIASPALSERPSRAPPAAFLS